MKTIPVVDPDHSEMPEGSEAVQGSMNLHVTCLVLHQL